MSLDFPTSYQREGGRPGTWGGACALPSGYRGAEVAGTRAWGFGERRSSCLTDAARLGDVVEGPEQVTPQLLDVDEVIHHGVGEVHQVVQVDGVALGPLESHVKRSCLTCQDLGESQGAPPSLGVWGFRGTVASAGLRTLRTPPFSEAGG